jgi:hypothetical protein
MPKSIVWPLRDAGQVHNPFLGEPVMCFTCLTGCIHVQIHFVKLTSLTSYIHGMQPMHLIAIGRTMFAHSMHTQIVHDLLLFMFEIPFLRFTSLTSHTCSWSLCFGLNMLLLQTWRTINLLALPTTKARILCLDSFESIVVQWILAPW